MSKYMRCPRAQCSREEHSSCLDTCRALSEHHAHFAAQDRTSSSCTWPDFQPIPELITSSRIMLGETPLNSSCPVWKPLPTMFFSAPWEQTVFAPVQCHAAPWLEAVPVRPWDFHPGLQSSSVPESQMIYSFLILCCSLCPGSDGDPQACSGSYSPYTTCRNAGMSTECLALTLTDLILLPGSCSNATKMNHMGSPSTWGH